MKSETIREGKAFDKTLQALSSWQGMTPISLVVITKNAEEHLERCLKSVPFASDLVVVDSGSSDRTVEIARTCGARVYIEEWRGFGRQKRRATELAQNDWVLNLDADEALSSEAAEELRTLLASGILGGSAAPEINEAPTESTADGVLRKPRADEAPSKPTASRAPPAFAYSFPRLSFHMGRWIRFGGWYPDRQIRFYDRRRANWTEADLHEKVQADRVGRFKQPLLHWVFRDLSDQVATNNRYSTLGSETLQAKGQRFRLLHLIVKPWVKFLETYLWKRGFLDGLPGFVISVGAAYSVFLKWAKLWEAEKRKAKS